MIGWKEGYTKGVIGPIFFFIIWAKVGGDGKKGRRKRVARGCQKREDRREKRMIGGKRGERKGKCDP